MKPSFRNWLATSVSHYVLANVTAKDVKRLYQPIKKEDKNQ